MIREFVLQLKRGSVRPAYFHGKYGVNVLRSLPRSARVARGGRTPGRRPETTSIAITRDALLRVDTLLPRFFLPQHTGIRYT